MCKKAAIDWQSAMGSVENDYFVAALRSKALTAPRVLDGPLNGEGFRAWVQQCLLPTLRPGDGVMMDHRRLIKLVASVKPLKALEQYYSIYPPYFPDLNPIEFAFSKLKSLLRKAAARTVRSRWKTVGNSLRAFTPDQCQHFFNTAGYHC